MLPAQSAREPLSWYVAYRHILKLVIDSNYFQVGGPVIVEETSLCFQALGGLPGPYLQEFERKLGPQGLAVLLHGFQSRAATAVCIFAYSPGPGSEPVLFEGRTDGEVVPARNGQAGWESIFQIAGTGRT
jgi:inosine triphosphate pyrophosphatase